VANTNLTISKITFEALMVLENMLGFTGKVNRQYDDQFAVAGAKIGDVLNVRKPVRYTVSTGQALDLQDVKETSVPVKLDTQNHVDFQFSSQDLALTIDNFRSRYLMPAVAALANKIDWNGLQLYKQVWNHVGTPGTVPNSLLTYLQATAKLNHNACPKDGMRHCVVGPTMEVTLTNALLAYFNPVRAIADQFRTGEMGEAAGLKFQMDQNLATHTIGNAVGTPVTNGTTADGATSIVTDGWTNSSSTTNLKKGDVVSITDVYAVNPQSRESTGQLMQFVVTQDISDTGGAITIPISPTIHLAGPEQNCYCATVPIPSEKAILVMDTAQAGLAGIAGDATPQGLAFHRDAFTLACADLPLPGGTDMAARASDKQLGLSIRIVRQYDISTDQWPCRLDILYGWAALRPELACRISS
jgi:P22 coat protein - gene protein 5